METTFCVRNLSSYLTRALCDLGTSADEVANSLASQGIQGVRHTMRQLNPIVRYVWMQVGECRSVVLSPSGNMSVLLPNDDQTTVQLPQAVVAFLSAFNAGRYPQLELPLQRV